MRLKSKEALKNKKIIVLPVNNFDLIEAVKSTQQMVDMKGPTEKNCLLVTIIYH